MKKIMLICAALLALITSCNKGKESGIHYRGGWDRCVNARLVFANDSVVNGEFWSSDFVGHFNDKMSGRYQIEDDSVMIIQWEENKHTNSVYTKVPITDTLHICCDTLPMHRVRLISMASHSMPKRIKALEKRRLSGSKA